jgi:F0F1-type ATP synthase assembly protein I
MVALVKMKYNFFEIDKQGSLKKTSQNLKKKSGAKKSSLSDLMNMNVGYNLATPILVGVIIGLALDSHFHSKPVFTVSFIFFGAISSFYNLFRLIKQDATHKH